MDNEPAGRYSQVMTAGLRRFDFKKIPLSGLLLAAGSLEYIIGFIVGDLRTPNYNYVSDSISNLGARGCVHLSSGWFCPPDNVLIDDSFIVLGLTTLAGLILLTRKSSNPFWLAGLAFFGVASICVILVGLFPVNVDYNVHSIVSDIAFPTGAVGIGLMAFSRQLGVWMTRYSWATAVFALIAIIVHFSMGGGWTYAGLSERLVVGPQIIWILMLGVYIILNPASKDAEQ